MSSSSAFDLIELSRQLKQERLFINAEREQLRQLNSEVCKTADSLYCLSWISRQQKANLNDLGKLGFEFKYIGDNKLYILKKTVSNGFVNS